MFHNKDTMPRATAPPSSNKFRKMLLYWLKKNKLYYDEIIFCSEENSSTEKLDICLKNHRYMKPTMMPTAKKPQYI